jgi:hypothetical protein
VDCLAVAADETATKVNVLEVVFFGLEVGDLTNVVTIGRGQWIVNSWC